MQKNILIKSLYKKPPDEFEVNMSHWGNYTEPYYKRNIFVFAPIFHELNSKI